jgi:nucleotide-binding universal stress UspA family protein
MNSPAATRVIVGFDGSPSASAAINTGALLLPHAHASITHLWTPPFTDEDLRHRLWSGRHDLDEFIQAVEREGEWRATRIADIGVTLARAAGWQAEALLRRVEGGEGLELAQLVRDIAADLALVGARGLGGVRAVLGSVSDMAVHYSPKPVLVAPHPMLSADHAALADGPVIIGWDGSLGAQTALTATERLLPDRTLLLAYAEDDMPDTTASPPPTSTGRVLVPLRINKGHGTPTQAIANALIAFARDHEAARLVVGSRGRNALQRSSWAVWPWPSCTMPTGRSSSYPASINECEVAPAAGDRGRRPRRGSPG